MSREIVAEGALYRYFPAAMGAAIGPALAAQMSIPERDPALVGLASATDYRAVQVPHWRADAPWLAAFLHWDDGTDLAELDRRVSAGQARDADFEASIKCQSRVTGCVACGADHRTLVVDSGDVYLGVAGLAGEKLARGFERRRFLGCPRCGERLRQLVVKVFEPRGAGIAPL